MQNNKSNQTKSNQTKPNEIKSNQMNKNKRCTTERNEKKRKRKRKEKERQRPGKINERLVTKEINRFNIQSMPLNDILRDDYILEIDCY